MREKQIFGIVTLLLISGALLSRTWAKAGLFVSLVGMVIWLFIGLRSLLRLSQNWGALTVKLRVRMILRLILLGFMVYAVVTGTISWFFILILLAADFLAGNEIRNS